MSFRDWVAEFLDTVDPGLSKHAHVIEAYGASCMDHIAKFEEQDIAALGISFAADGMKPLQVKWVKQAFTSRHARHKAAFDGMKRSAAKRAAKAAAHPQPAPDDSSGEEDGEEDGEESDEEYVNGEGGDEAAPDARRRLPSVVHRPRSYAGKAKAASSAKSAASGRGKITSMFNVSPSMGNRHGLGGQASAEAAEGGRARPFAGLGARGKGAFCTLRCCLEEDTASLTCICPAIGFVAEIIGIKENTDTL